MVNEKHLGSDKKEDILDVAEDLFAQFGFEAVSVRQLAKEAGINVAMVSYYFGSKEQLFKQVIERKLINTGNLIASSTNLDHWEKIFRIADGYIDGFFQNRKISQIIYREINLNQPQSLNQSLNPGRDKPDASDSPLNIAPKLGVRYVTSRAYAAQLASSQADPTASKDVTAGNISVYLPFLLKVN